MVLPDVPEEQALAMYLVISGLEGNLQRRAALQASQTLLVLLTLYLLWHGLPWWLGLPCCAGATRGGRACARARARLRLIAPARA